MSASAVVRQILEERAAAGRPLSPSDRLLLLERARRVEGLSLEELEAAKAANFSAGGPLCGFVATVIVGLIEERIEAGSTPDEVAARESAEGSFHGADEPEEAPSAEALEALANLRARLAADNSASQRAAALREQIRVLGANRLRNVEKIAALERELAGLTAAPAGPREPTSEDFIARARERMRREGEAE